MRKQRFLKDATAINSLAKRLSKCPQVKRYDKGKHNEAGTIAYAFSDLEESFYTFLENHLPKLAKGKLTPTEIYDLLLEVGEEFRHILYHINDCRFYQYLDTNSDQEGKKDK